MATNFNMSPKRRKTRMWLIFVTAAYKVRSVTNRNSTSTGIFVIKDSVSGTTTYAQIGSYTEYWYLHDKYTSFEAAKGEVTRLADLIPIGDIHLVASVDLITDFLPRS